ncbi:helix-turn-helix domain-containing protein [Butyricicoccus pullicaecorum]|uniref:helix-turn-helix domain-containing protein n=1 Tax=Butyricicoccus pullicaecorum TaxID=501571 RepID=UPI0035212743
MIESYITVNALAEKWGLSPRTVQIMCAEGKIDGAVKFGRSWAIPVDAERPADGRVFSGKYKDWRKKEE